MNTLEKLVKDIDERKQFLLDVKKKTPDKRNKAWMLYNQDSKELLELTYGHVLASIERKSSLTHLVARLGNCVNRRKKLKLDEIAEVHIGWFILIAYFEVGLLSYYSKRTKQKGGKWSKYASYQIKVNNLEEIKNLIQCVQETSVDLFPLITPPKDWGSNFSHEELGYPLIKHAHEDAVALAKTLDLSFLTSTLNKLQHTGWVINERVFDTFKASMNSEKTPFKFTTEIDSEKKASLLIEVEAIKALAKRFKGKTFYHLYNVDFRGRIYPNTAFLHEQSSDNAKGLLLLSNPVALGLRGLHWLSVYTSNMWGNDSVSLEDRAAWVTNNMDDILLYASDPMENTGWMKAEKPFCFLACCCEFDMLSNWHGDGYATEDFPSCLPVYIDGSNNGVQHLVAMSKDEKIAPLVNLVPSKLPGDVYMFIAEKTRASVALEAKQLPKSFYTKFDEIYPQLRKLKQTISLYLPGTEKYDLSVRQLKDYSNQVYDAKKQLGPIFWSNITDKKVWRKTVKRPTMTLGYGSSQYGMVEMVHEDTRDLSSYLRDKDKAWSSYLGHKIYKTCYKELEKPTQLLSMFEKLAVRENSFDRPISFIQQKTNFPFVHSYKEAKSKEVEVFYGGTSIRLTVHLWKKATLKKSKQKSGAAPNIVHSIDALHLTMVVHDAVHEVTVVHDSFGCNAGNMDSLFCHVREKFVELYENNPLEHIMLQLNALDLIPKKGALDVKSILKSDFAFA